jgi:hypothetical protein
MLDDRTAERERDNVIARAHMAAVRETPVGTTLHQMMPLILAAVPDSNALEIEKALKLFVRQAEPDVDGLIQWTRSRPYGKHQGELERKMREGDAAMINVVLDGLRFARAEAKATLGRKQKRRTQ